MKLYVIGNGFDCFHKLETSYSSFGIYLKQHYNEVYDLLLEHYGFRDLDIPETDPPTEPLWSEFEANLATLDKESVLDAYIEAMPCYANPEFKDRDRYDFKYEIEYVLKLLTSDLYNAFKEFILSIEHPLIEKDSYLDLDKDAIYLSFNYTDTLTRYYGIPEQNVLFIHNKATSDDAVKLILGHGIDPDNFKDKPATPPAGVSDEERDEWFDAQSAKYDYSFEIAKDEINKYFKKTFKCTNEIIERNSEFFRSLSNVDEVYILGHSLAKVDLPYFIKLSQSVKPDAKWTATYYSTSDKQRHFDTLKGLGISDISVVSIEDI